MSEPAGALGVGSALAEARQAQGLAIADVAQQLKFMPRQLEALEAERFTSLPGPTIARGMVRSYARLLKLDPGPLLEKMTGQVPGADATPQLAARFSQPVPFSDSGRRSTVAYLTLSALVLAMAGGVFYEWRHERAAPRFIAAARQPAPPRPAHAAAVHTPLAPARLPVVPASTPAPGVAAAAAPTVKGAEAAQVPPAPAKSAVVASAKPAATAAHGDAALSASETGRIVLQCEEESWIEVTDGAGRVLVSSLNPPGTERVVRGEPPFSLVIGNAHHVKVSYNDREVDLQPHVRVEVARFTLP
ncbi:MAG TPA: RodZ domain-containing protein [Burkholderiales bacterium]|nr:RodZ domain-containing protein [Burkholderiales bacterium]